MKPWLDAFLSALEPDAYEEHGHDVAFEQEWGLHGLIRPSATGKGLRVTFFVSEPVSGRACSSGWTACRRRAPASSRSSTLPTVRGCR